MLDMTTIKRLLAQSDGPESDGSQTTRFAHAIEREAYRRAAAECRKVQDWHTFEYRRGRNARSNPYLEGKSNGAGECAAAVEALGREE